MQTGPLDVNTYIVHEKSSKECIVIDPGDGERVKKYIDSVNLKCTHILLTHGHFDHMMGVAYLKKETGAQVLIHEADAAALTSDKYNLSAFTGMTTEKCEPDGTLTDGDVVKAAGVEITTMHTPGHSKGSVCYIIESDKVVFSGDTLFYLSVGRTDLFNSDEKDLVYSILYKLYTLSGEYTVLPGHGEATELQFEKENNPVTNHMDYE